MKRILYWFVVAVVCIVLPAILAELSTFFLGEMSDANQTLVKILVFVIGFQFSLALSLSFNWEFERAGISKALAKETQSLVLARIQEAIDGGLIGIFMKGRTGAEVSGVFKEMAEMMAARVRDNSPELLEASSVFLKEQLSVALSNHEELLRQGLMVDISQHLRTTRHLCTKYSSYLQIQRRAFQAPEEWTADWMAFLEESSKRSIKKKYILLASAAELEGNASKIDSMRIALGKKGFEFATCNTASITDSTGGSIPTAGVIEVFGDRIIKIGDLPEGRYQGGIHLKMLLLDGDKRQDLLNFTRLVERLAAR